MAWVPRLGAGLFVAGAVAVGCAGSSDDPEPGAVTSTSVWCGALCSALKRCGDPETNDACARTCAAQRPGLVHYSVSGAQALAPCVGGLACSELFDQQAWDAAMTRCWESAQTSVETRQHVRDFCAQWSLSWFECGAAYSTTDCEQNYALWADSVLDQLEPCTGRPTCSELDSCTRGLFQSM